MAQILTTLTAHDSTFSRAQLAKEVNARTEDGADFTALLAQVEARPELVRLPNAKDRYSTKTMVDIEREIASVAEDMSGRKTHGVVPRRRTGHSNVALSSEQQIALDHLIGSSALSSLVGYAGGWRGHSPERSRSISVATATWLRLRHDHS